ncbi:BTAD domain-containing putative transcriptional regulator [Actinoplanes sp. NPDC051851]|uniref:BTAD domain-containing putative transcriptional regulator n=1 Tax=Actinoplanes sp. NPDC051851 TaxID=3154753 RepID=UPI003418119C
MDFQVFGGVDVFRRGERIDTGPQRQRCVLAVLMVEAGRAVSPAELIDRVWGDDPPQRARGALHNYISRLRRVLAPDARVARRPDGYCLEIDPDDVDMHRFRSLIAAEKLDEALAIWRERPFGALDTPWLDGVRENLQRERHAAELDRNDRALAAGRHAELLHGLAGAVEAYPYDERLAGQYMLALSRGGRPSDALRYYETLRRRLADELGMDPNPALRGIHLEILTAGAHPPVEIPDVRTPPAPTTPPAPVPPARIERPEPPRPRRWWLLAGAVAVLAGAGLAGALAAGLPDRRAETPPSASPSYPDRLAPLTGEIPDRAVVAIVNRRSATSVAESFVVDVENWAVEAGARTHLWHWRDDGDYRNQLWRVRHLPGGTRHLVNMLSGKCLSGVLGAADVRQEVCAADDPAQRWTFRPDGRLADDDGADCLSVREGLLLQDTGLQVLPCGPDWSQEWLLVARP